MFSSKRRRWRDDETRSNTQLVDIPMVEVKTLEPNIEGQEELGIGELMQREELA